MRSVMTHQFSQVPQAQIQRSVFNRSHGHKTTFDAGYLVPIIIDEILPGDSFTLNTSGFIRLATPIKPIMDNMYITTFFFAVPYRLLWDNFKRFMGEKDNPSDSTTFYIPQMRAPAGTGIQVGELSDYFGLPTGAENLPFNSLWHRGYNKIWNQWFRDQNLQNSVHEDQGDGPDTYSDYVLLRRGKRHDYFTSCLPWPQKGPDVTIPLGTEAPVKGIGPISQNFSYGSAAAYETGGGHPTYTNAKLITDTTDDQKFIVEEKGTTGYPYIRADLSAATAQTINALRQAFQLQRLYERDARGGTRYTEIVKAHFGVTSPDARQQRPEYLGGGKALINIHPVPQTSKTDTSPQGNLAGFGTASFVGHGFSKSFTEHCVLIGLACVDADLTYQQGCNRMFNRRTRFDMYWPALAHLGEQSVLNMEIYCKNDSNDTLVFGYQERFAEYRYKPSQITGKFRSTYATPLDMWHLSQEFSSLPTLDSTFIQSNPPIDRVIAVNTEPHFLADFYFDMKCARPMPVYGVPGMMDHF